MDDRGADRKHLSFSGDGYDSRIVEFLDRTDGLTPFTRNSGAARLTADAVMAEVRRGHTRHRGQRVGALLAAAAMVAILSSALTAFALRGAGTVDVRFVLVAPDATTVSLVADFNGWSATGHTMKRTADGSWEITVPLEKGRSYAYNFVINGDYWISDPSAAVRLDDGFGGSSSGLSL